MDAGNNLRLFARKNAMKQNAKVQGSLIAGAFVDNNAKYLLEWGSYPNEQSKPFGTFSQMGQFILDKKLISPNSPLFQNVGMNNPVAFNNALQRRIDPERSVVSFGDFEIFKLK